MKLTVNQIFKKAEQEIKKSNFKNAIYFYKSISKIEPLNFNAYLFLGLTLDKIGNHTEAKENYEKVIKIKPNCADAYYNLANFFINSNDFNKAKENLEKAITFKTDFAYAYYNLGNIFYLTKNFSKAKIQYKKAIKYKPDYTDAYFNLGNTLKDLGELESAEFNFKKVLSLTPNYSYPVKNCLEETFKFKKLLSNIKNNDNELDHLNFKNKPFITSRPVEKNLIKYLYKIKSRKFDETIDARYGSGGRCSLDFDLFNDNDAIIKNVSKDIIEICENIFNKKIYVFDSFFNILNTSGGTTPHAHLSEFDRSLGFINRKYSLVYYVSTGDKNCSNPGILKLHEPDGEILPEEGMIVIIPANHKHSAVYNGKKDRILIGVNFYCL